MKYIITIIIIALAGFGIYFISKPSEKIDLTGENPTETPTETATTTPKQDEMLSREVIGKSVQGRDITAYHFGTGSTELLFVGGIHGGYGPNTSLVVYQFSDYLDKNPEIIPANLKITLIPTLNPDGLYKSIGVEGYFSSFTAPSASVQASGRFNANTVDLNRNFDCDWKSSGVWLNKKVSGGTEVFSEPESLALKNYVETHPIAGAVVWYSAGGGVYASSCGGSVSAETDTLTKTYAKAAGYSAHQDFTSYALTGDMVNWLAKKNIPAISVLLTDHTNSEWNKNKAGIEAVLKIYTK